MPQGSGVRGAMPVTAPQEPAFTAIATAAVQLVSGRDWTHKAESPPASLPSSAINASSKSPVETPLR